MTNHSSDNKKRWALAIGLISICPVLFLLGLIYAGGWPWFQKFLENSAPAWVQAIGSIMAILAAIYISRTQIASDRAIDSARLADEECKKVLVIDALLEALESSVKLTEEQFSKYPSMPVYPYFLERVRTASQALAKIDLFMCPAPIIQPLLHLFPTPCENLIEVLRLFGESFDDLYGAHEKHWPRVRNSFTVEGMMIGLARNACKLAIKPGSAKT